jgi:predicted amidophosphoribosyltransferase
MKLDSCRQCGKEMEINKKCNICSEANQFFCHGCGYVSDEQIHFQCMMISFDHALLETRKLQK